MVHAMHSHKGSTAFPVPICTNLALLVQRSENMEIWLAGGSQTDVVIVLLKERLKTKCRTVPCVCVWCRKTDLQT